MYMHKYAITCYYTFAMKFSKTKVSTDSVSYKQTSVRVFRFWKFVIYRLYMY